MAKRKQHKLDVPHPIDMSTSQTSHFEGHSAAPKLHLGQRVTAKVHGIVEEMSHQHAGKGHRIRIKPDSISYMGHKSEKPTMKQQMKKVRVVASTPKRRSVY
jgi:hypothetical protein